MPVYSVDQAPGSCILRRKNFLSVYEKLYVWDLNPRHLRQTYILKILDVEQQLLYTIHLRPLPLTRALEGFFLSVETRVFVDVTAGLNPMKNPLRARVGGNRRNVRSRGKQIALFSRES